MSDDGGEYSFDELCRLRDRVTRLLSWHLHALLQFAIYADGGQGVGARDRHSLRGFVHLTDGRPSASARVSLASTATCVRSLHTCTDREWRQLDLAPLAAEIRHRYGEEQISTTGLGNLNPFTVGQLVPILPLVGVLDDDDVSRTLRDQLQGWSDQYGVAIGEFPPNGYLSYWVLAALRAAGGQGLTTSRLVAWSHQELHRHIALLSAGDDEEGDAFQLAYNLVIQVGFNGRSLRPTIVRQALVLLKDSQLQRGMWEKKEPLFVWERGGDAYCFSFELLGTLLYEFRNRYAQLRPFDDALELSLEWAERNAHRDNPSAPPIWRSGHRTENKAPESWATAEVYAFLRRYEHYLDHRINSRLLDRYRGVPATAPNADAFSPFYQPEVRAERVRQSEPLLGDVLRAVLLEPLRIRAGEEAFSLVRASAPNQRARSAILFGPPGTGKSSYVRALAQYLGWPLVVLDPSDFASDGLSLMPTTISKIFADLREGRDIVIFLDEMEELMRDRRSDRSNPGDVTFEQRLLTTALLPKLQDLHDQSRSLFFVATNHYDKIDEAARRFGRFDLTIEVLPACLNEKRRHLVDAITEGQGDLYSTDAQAFIAALDQALRGLDSPTNADLRERLEWATFGEVRAVASAILDGQNEGRDAGPSLTLTLKDLDPSIKSDEWRDGYQFNNTTPRR